MIPISHVMAREIDGDHYALLASLDLGSEFDVVNVELLLERLCIIRIPYDIVTLIREWLKSRHLYARVDDDSSDVHHSDVGTV